MFQNFKKYISESKQRFLSLKPSVKAGISILFITVILLSGYVYYGAQKTKAWYSGWTYRKSITINESQIPGSGSFTDFPVLISITDANLQSSAQSDGDDILFTSSDGNTKLDHEIETYTSGSGVLIAWVKIPSLSNTTNTTIYMYYGNAGASNQQNPIGVWNSNYKAVYHFSETSGTYYDSTSNNNDSITVAGTITRSATGKIGTAPDLSGAGGTYIEIADSPSVDIGGTAATLQAWVRPDSVPTSGNQQSIIGKPHSASPWSAYEMYIIHDGSQVQTDSKISNSGSDFFVGTSTVNTNGNWYMYHTALAGVGNTLGGYTNGASDVNYTLGTFSGTILNSDGSLTIGSSAPSGGNEFNGIIDEVRIVSTNLSADWMASEYNNQNAPGSFTTVGSQETETPSPVSQPYNHTALKLHWNLDEQYGTTSNDSSGRAHPGTVSDALWKTQDLCHTSGCLQFDGTDDKLTRGYSSDTDLDPGTGGFTAALWFRHPSTIASTQYLLSRFTGAGYKIYMNSSGQICFGIDFDSTWTPADTACSSSSYADSQWHHVTAVKVSTTRIELYIDGVFITQDASLSAATSLSGTTPGFNVGVDSSGSSGYWSGFIDDIKYFNAALSQSEINGLQQTGSVTDSTNAVLGKQQPSNYLSNGLVGYWKLDEKTGTSALDSSGNSITGTLTNSPTWMSAAKYGSGATFANSTNHITMGDSSVLELTTFTISGWIYRTGACGTFNDCTIAAKGPGSNTGYQLGVKISSGNYKASLNIRDQQTVFGTSTINTNQWYHIAATLNGTTIRVYVNGILETESTQTSTPTFGSESFKIGNTNTNNDLPLVGSIDEVRVYNRTLDTAEVASLYEFGPSPAGYWKLDESTGTSTGDSSGNNNSGTLTNSASWSSGKYGGATYLDPATTDKYVNIPVSGSSNLDDLPQTTIEAWIYIAANNLNYGVYTKKSSTYFKIENSSGTSRPALVLDYSTTDLTYLTSSDANLTANTWTHIVATWNGTTDSTNGVAIYVNGVKVTRSGSSVNGVGSYVTDAGSAARIGNNNSGNEQLGGKVDEVRVYNYIRSPKQIIQDINSSSSGMYINDAYPRLNLKFDEGYGTTANNSGLSGSVINGTLTNLASPATSTSGWTNSGVFGKAVVLDGSNDYITSGTNASLNLTGGSLSLSVWIKRANSTQTGVIASRGTAGASGYSIGIGNVQGSGCTTHQISFGKLGLSWQCINSFPADTNWHHLVVTADAVTEKLYIDGALTGSAADTQSIITSTDSFRIGIGTDGAYLFAGTLDEIKMYPYPLSPNEIKLEYNNGKSNIFGANSTSSNGSTPDNSSARSYCVPGDTTTCSAPVAEWNFEEGSGSTANDTSGSGLSGTLNDNAGFTDTRVGKALKFDGNGDYVNFASSIADTTNLTISGWFKLNSLDTSGATLMYMRTNSVKIGVETAGTNKLVVKYHKGSSTWNETATGAIYNDSTWHHLTYINDGTNNVQRIYIDGALTATTTFTEDISWVAGATVLGREGAADTSYELNGSLDNIKVYNYARTNAQVQWDYRRGNPFSWWKLDECSGTSANDTQASSNGTISIGATVPYSSAGTCSSGTSTHAWYAGATAKLNSGLGLDGVDDKVDFGDLSTTESATQLSWSAWVKPNSAGTSKCIFCKMNTSAASQISWGIMTDSGSATTLHVKIGTTTSDNSTYGTLANALPNSTWTHIAVVFDGTASGNANRLKIYINGVSQTVSFTGTIPASTQATTSNAVLGASSDSSSYFAGVADEVKVFNYPLTDTQVKLQYNNAFTTRM